MEITSYFLIMVFTLSGLAIGYGENSFNVLDFGVIGDGKTDDSNAFVKAWRSACGAAGGAPTLTIPARKSYLLKSIRFTGPCRSNSIRVQFEGSIVAPNSRSQWTGCESAKWMQFVNVKGLVITGTGQIDGRGYIWWRKKPNQFNHTEHNNGRTSTCKAPNALHFNKCDNLRLEGFTSRNSPNKHISIQNSNGVSISNLRIDAPGNSPNTDGIDISSSSQVNIKDSFIRTGDDCIAIKGGSSYINITHVTCGPGHGISIGSLGFGSGSQNVEEVHVRNCDLTGSTNGARIKTWPRGNPGYARAITFEHIRVSSCKYPIIIDQGYHELLTGAKVKVSDVTFRDFRGTSMTPVAIKLDCSELSCNNIVLDNINLSSARPGKPVTSFCRNVHGKAISTVVPHVPCLSSS
ncbi:hypothetical protein UlMin_035546 [Ulmus minor]